MLSGLKTLHQIDAALAKSRASAAEAARLAQRAAEAVASVQLQQAEGYNQIARDRLDLIEAGGGGALGYIDRQVEKHLSDHRAAVAKAADALTKAESAVEALEAKRRAQEKTVADAVDAYDKTVAASEAALLKDADYLAQIARVEQAEATLQRALDKLELAKTDEVEKGTPYREDPFFAYLSDRRYGTKEAKGWFLTKALDHWVARIADYRQAAENYRRLTAIPTRLAAHCDDLEHQIGVEQTALQAIEAAKLDRDGVNTARQTSVDAQAKLDAIDADIAKAEARYQEALSAHAKMSAGDIGPMREAMDALEAAIAKMDRRNLQRLAAQTQTLTDDHAIERLRELAETARDLRDDKAEAERLMRKYQTTQKQIEAVRQRFKSRRYDAPSSTFNNSDVLLRVLGQVLAGALGGDDLWRQIERAQRTMRRYSDSDFGGIDWEDAFRIPRSSGGIGGGGRSRSGSRRRSRTSLPRMPRQRLPKISTGGGWGGSSRSGRSGGGFKMPKSGGRRGGGFRTGGGF